MEKEIKKLTELAKECIAFAVEVGQKNPSWVEYSNNIRVYVANGYDTKSVQFYNEKIEISFIGNGEIHIPLNCTKEILEKTHEKSSLELKKIIELNMANIKEENKREAANRIEHLKSELERLENIVK